MSWDATQAPYLTLMEIGTESYVFKTEYMVKLVFVFFNKLQVINTQCAFKRERLHVLSGGIQ